MELGLQLREMERDYAITADQRIEYVYTHLAAISPYVRRSMLIYECVPTDHTRADQHTGYQVSRRVLWMTTSHPFFPVVFRLAEQKYASTPIGKVHNSSLAGIPMCGVDSVLVDEVADLIWSRFLANTARFPVYAEDGTRLETMSLAEHAARRDDGDIALVEHAPVSSAQSLTETTLDTATRASLPSEDPGILIGADQHVHLYRNSNSSNSNSSSSTMAAVAPSFDHPKKE